ncbi:MAG: radical SAM protein [Anaerolineales bacterium]|nr:radical SAM protein [Anaerolineales bacterium]
MKLTGLHLLLTYQCTFECDHCFVFGSPSQTGVMTIPQIQEILRQARETGTIASIYFEGGEPFLYYAVMLKGLQEAVKAGFSAGIVSNAYWATGLEDALEWLRPFAGLAADLSISSDLYHYDERNSQHAQNAARAAEQLGIPLGVICVAQPEDTNAMLTIGQIPTGESAVMYRGRAACKLVSRAKLQPWEGFSECPHEDLREPGRCHLDPLGNLHVCQGITLGNIFETPLKEICATYDVEAHPIAGPLLAGGPVALVQEYNLPHEENYADACHLCFESRRVLRERFPEILKPDQMYGVDS